MIAIRPPDGETLKYVTKVWRKYNKRFQLLPSTQFDESTIKVVSMGIGQMSPVGKAKKMETKTPFR